MDIAMCSGEGCPLKDTCYRAKGVPGMMQSYFIEPPFEDDKCEYFMTIEKGTRVKDERS